MILDLTTGSRASAERRLIHGLEEAATEHGGTDERGLPRTAKAVLLGAVLVGLLAIVALGSRGGHPGGHGRLSQRQVPVRVADDLLTVLVVVYVLGFLVLVQVFLAIKGKWVPVKSHWVRNMLAVLLLTSIAAVVGHRLITHSGLARKVQQQQPEAPITGRDRTRAHAGGHAASSRTARFDWTLASGLIGLLVVGGAIYWVRNRRVQPLDPDDLDVDAVAADLSAALSDAIDDLEREPDARRAVIAAYARMEGALARGGLGRRAAEAPFEYVARVLARLHVSAAAAHELTELFEQAKFSPRTVDAEMKDRAIAAFVAVRDDLRVPVGA